MAEEDIPDYLPTLVEVLDARDDQEALQVLRAAAGVHVGYADEPVPFDAPAPLELRISLPPRAFATLDREERREICDRLQGALNEVCEGRNDFFSSVMIVTDLVRRVETLDGTIVQVQPKGLPASSVQAIEVPYEKADNENRR